VANVSSYQPAALVLVNVTGFEVPSSVLGVPLESE